MVQGAMLDGEERQGAGEDGTMTGRNGEVRMGEEWEMRIGKEG